jgi:predicted transcriptional regulator
MNIPKSTINYHLNHLKKQEVIIRKDADKYTRYYVANNVSEYEKKILHIFRQEIPSEIIIYLLLSPNSSQVKISKKLNKHPTTISFHLDKLMNTDIVESMPNGNEINYKIKNPQYICDLLNKYKECFLEDTITYVITSLGK